MAKQKLYGNRSEPSCETCALGRRTSDGKTVLCSRAGVVPLYHHCRRFVYDPLRRTPHRDRPLEHINPQAFSLDEVLTEAACAPVQEEDSREVLSRLRQYMSETEAPDVDTILSILNMNNSDNIPPEFEEIEELIGLVEDEETEEVEDAAETAEDEETEEVEEVEELDELEELDVLEELEELDEVEQLEKLDTAEKTEESEETEEVEPLEDIEPFEEIPPLEERKTAEETAEVEEVEEAAEVEETEETAEVEETEESEESRQVLREIDEALAGHAVKDTRQRFDDTPDIFEDLAHLDLEALSSTHAAFQTPHFELPNDLFEDESLNDPNVAAMTKRFAATATLTISDEDYDDDMVLNPDDLILLSAKALNDESVKEDELVLNPDGSITAKPRP